MIQGRMPIDSFRLFSQRATVLSDSPSNPYQYNPYQFRQCLICNILGCLTVSVIFNKSSKVLHIIVNAFRVWQSSEANVKRKQNGTELSFIDKYTS